ncbi:hypothetical protein PMI36_04336, partial [Pseudomonas sp. GM79]
MRYPVISRSVPAHQSLISLTLVVCAGSSVAVQADQS